MNGIQKIIKVGAIILAIVIIVNICSMVFYGLSWIFDLNDNQGKVNFEETYQDVREIEIDGISSSIEIVSGSEFKVVAKNLDNGISAKVKNGVLKIEEKGKWFYQKTSDGIIYITVPNNQVLDELSIDSGAGKFVIKDISARDFDMDHGAGVLEISNVNFYQADIDGGAGKIQIKDSTLNNLDLDAGAGKVEIEARISGNSQINCGVGEVDISLIGEEDDYEIKAEKGIGNITIASVEQKNSTTYGNGSAKIEIEGGIGNINVSFQD